MKKQRLLRSSVDVCCPFCGTVSAVAIDEGGGETQSFVDDCEVCCKPRIVHVGPPGSGNEEAWVERGGGM
jgi:hypothetical protein